MFRQGKFYVLINLCDYSAAVAIPELGRYSLEAIGPLKDLDSTFISLSCYDCS